MSPCDSLIVRRLAERLRPLCACVCVYARPSVQLRQEACVNSPGHKKRIISRGLECVSWLFFLYFLCVSNRSARAASRRLEKPGDVFSRPSVCGASLKEKEVESKGGKNGSPDSWKMYTVKMSIWPTRGNKMQGTGSIVSIIAYYCYC